MDICAVIQHSPNMENKSPFEKLTEIIALLRDPLRGCPWDKEQTHASLKPYLIEESYEVLDAIDNSPATLREELGDVLLQVMLHSQIAKDNGQFSVDDVVTTLNDKLVSRHPHVFGELEVKDSATVLKNWEEIKKQERKAKGAVSEPQSVLDGVPRNLPALLRAQRTGEKAARVGFEWNSVEEIRDKVTEELNEFLECCLDKDHPVEHTEEEFGDILFSLTQLARRMKFDSEGLLSSATDKFTRRFKKLEARAGDQLKTLGLEKLDQIWEDIKSEGK